jgi:hypothetical protein
MALLPKSGKASVGDSVCRAGGDNISPGYLLDCVGVSSEHEPWALADRVEVSMYVRRRGQRPRRSAQMYKFHIKIYGQCN